MMGLVLDHCSQAAYIVCKKSDGGGQTCCDHPPFVLGFQINEPNAYGNTPLHVACYNGQDVVVNELIECGANVNQVNEKGFAPLHFTAASRHGALCLELLVCNGADVNIKVGQKQSIASPCSEMITLSAPLSRC